MGITYTASVGMVVTDLTTGSMVLVGQWEDPPHQQVAPAVILPSTITEGRCCFSLSWSPAGLWIILGLVWIVYTPGGAFLFGDALRLYHLSVIYGFSSVPFCLS